MTTQEQRWATAERTLDASAARRIRRTPWIIIGIVALLVLAVGITAAVDLRRLQTPRGAALAWTEAATFGNCRAFFALSRPSDPLADRRTDDDLCRALRDASAPARADVTRVSITPRSVVQHGRSAVVLLDVRDPRGTRTIRLDLVHRGNDWLVLRGACGDTTCY